MEDVRKVAIIGKNRIEFESNGRRIRRFVTDKEAAILMKLIKDHDYIGIDSFCYQIV